MMAMTQSFFTSTKVRRFFYLTAETRRNSKRIIAVAQVQMYFSEVLFAPLRLNKKTAETQRNNTRSSSLLHSKLFLYRFHTSLHFGYLRFVATNSVKRSFHREVEFDFRFCAARACRYFASVCQYKLQYVRRW